MQEQQLCTSGHNWGAIELHGASLAFVIDGKPAFELPLPDVCTAQQNKDDVMLELHVDDTGGELAEDMLTEIGFYVPPSNQEFPGQGDDLPASKASLVPVSVAECASVRVRARARFRGRDHRTTEQGGEGARV